MAKVYKMICPIVLTIQDKQSVSKAYLIAFICRTVLEGSLLTPNTPPNTPQNKLQLICARYCGDDNNYYWYTLFSLCIFLAINIVFVVLMTVLYQI